MDETILLIIFSIVIVAMLLLDLGVFNRKQHVIHFKEATIWSSIWIVVACLFGVFIYYEFGAQKTTEYFAAYLTEKSLSLDNIFVFVLIFAFYKIDEKQKHKILFWGILGAIVLRAIFIFLGVELIQITYLPEFILFDKIVRVNVILTLFGIILIVSGIKAFYSSDNKESNKDFSDNLLIRLLKKRFPLSNNTEPGTFFVIENGVKCMTPLFLCLITIELADVVFAVDSIPAIFGITQDPIILYTSNIFAILGLRSLYFMLSSVIVYFKRLGQGIALILLFIGVKMIIGGFYHIDPRISLSVIGGILLVAILWSIIEKKRSK